MKTIHEIILIDETCVKKLLISVKIYYTVNDKKRENLVNWYKFTFGVCSYRDSKSL